VSNTSSKPETIEVVTSVQRRRRFAPAEKQAIVAETYAPGATVSYVARRHGIAPSQLYQWRSAMEDGALTAVNNAEKVVPQSEVKKLEDRVKRLERLLGRKTEEVECLKEAVRIAREKKLISRSPLVGVEDFE
jgi:transposase